MPCSIGHIRRKCSDGVIELKIKLARECLIDQSDDRVSDRHWPAADGEPRIRGSFTRAGGKGKEAGIASYSLGDTVDITHSRSRLERICRDGWAAAESGKQKGECFRISQAGGEAGKMPGKG